MPSLVPHGDEEKDSDRKRNILKEERTSESKTIDRNQKKRMIKTNAMVCRAVWITDMGYEKKRYKKRGGHINDCKYGEEWKKLVALNIITN